MRGQICKPIEPANQICEYCGEPVYIKTLHGLSHDKMLICLTDKEVKHNPNPVYYGDDGKWRFCDETWGDSGYGPYDTYKEALEAVETYCKEVLGT